MNLWITNDWSGGRAFLLSVNYSSAQFVSIPTQTICCSNKVEFFIISLESFFAAMTAAQFVPTLSQTGCSNHFVYFFMNCHWQRHSIFIRLKIYLLFFYIFQFHSLFFYEVSMTAALNLYQIRPDWILLKFIQWPPFPTKIDTFIFLRKLLNTGENLKLLIL